MNLGPPPNNVPAPIMDALTKRLREYPSKRFQVDECYKIINDFLLTPYLPAMIESLNKIHRIKVCQPDGKITALKLQYERDKKAGFWNWFKRLFSRYETGVMIWYNGQLFVCEYYKHSFFEMCDKMKVDFDAKMKSTLGCDFVLVCRAK